MDSPSTSNKKRKDRRHLPNQTNAHQGGRGAAINNAKTPPKMDLSPQPPKNMKRKANKTRGSSSKRANKSLGNSPSTKDASAKDVATGTVPKPANANAANNSATPGIVANYNNSGRQYTGVTFHPRHFKYEAQTCRGYNLGLFDLACDAALAYDVAHRITGGNGNDQNQGMSNDVEEIKYALNWLDLASEHDNPRKERKGEESAVNFTKPSLYREARRKEIGDYLTGNIHHPTFDVKNVPPEKDLKMRIKKEILNLARAYVEATTQQDGLDINRRRGSDTNATSSYNDQGRDNVTKSKTNNEKQEKDNKNDKAVSSLLKNKAWVPDETSMDKETAAARREQAEALLALQHDGNKTTSAAATRQDAQASEALLALQTKISHNGTNKDALDQKLEKITSGGSCDGAVSSSLMASQNEENRATARSLSFTSAPSAVGGSDGCEQPMAKNTEIKNVMIHMSNKSLEAAKDSPQSNQLWLNQQLQQQQALDKWNRALSESTAEATEGGGGTQPVQKFPEDNNAMGDKSSEVNEKSSSYQVLLLQQQQALDSLRAADKTSSNQLQFHQQQALENLREADKSSSNQLLLQQQHALENLRAADKSSSNQLLLQQQQALDSLRAADKTSPNQLQFHRQQALENLREPDKSSSNQLLLQQQQALENLRAADKSSSNQLLLRQQQALDNLRAADNSLSNELLLQQQQALDKLRSADNSSSDQLLLRYQQALENLRSGAAGSSTNNNHSALEQVLLLAAQHSDSIDENGSALTASAVTALLAGTGHEGPIPPDLAAHLQAALNEQQQYGQRTETMQVESAVREQHRHAGGGEDPQVKLQRELANEAREASLAQTTLSGLVAVGGSSDNGGRDNHQAGNLTHQKNEQVVKKEPESERERPREQGGTERANDTMAFGATPATKSMALKHGDDDEVAMQPQIRRDNVVPENIASTIHPSLQALQALQQQSQAFSGQQGLPESTDEQTIIQSLMLKKQMDEMKMNKQALEQKVQDYIQAKGGIMQQQQHPQPTPLATSSSGGNTEQLSRSIALQSLLSQEGDVDRATQQQNLAGQPPLDLARQMATQQQNLTGQPPSDLAHQIATQQQNLVGRPPSDLARQIAIQTLLAANHGTNHQQISDHLTHDVIHRRLVIESMLMSEEGRLRQLREALQSQLLPSHPQQVMNQMGGGGFGGLGGNNNINPFDSSGNLFNNNNPHQELLALERERAAAVSSMANDELRRVLLTAENNASTARQSQENALRQALALRASATQDGTGAPLAERLLEAARSLGLDPQTMTPAQLAQLMGMSGLG